MAEDKNIISRFFSKTPVRLLMFSALVLFLSSFFINLYTQYYDAKEKQQLIAAVSHNITETASSKLGILIQNNDLESLESIAKELAQQNAIIGIEIFENNGSPITKTFNSPQPLSPLKVVNHIFHEQQKVGFLIISFDQNKLLKLNNNLPAKSLAIWFISAVIWGLMFVLFTAKSIPNLLNTFKTNKKPLKNKPQKIESHVLRDILKRDQQKRQDSSYQTLLVIQAPWAKLNAKANNQLLHLFNRWLPQNDSFALSMKGNLLQIGVNKSLDTETINRIRTLKLSLDRLKLKPTILVHTLGFGDAIYRTFFQIIEPGIWFEETIGNQLNIDIHRTIELEIEMDSKETKGATGVNEQYIQLCQLVPFNAQQRSAVERQIRYLLG